MSDTFHIIKDGVIYELWPEEGSGYVITVPALPGCTSFGETIDEAMTMIAEAMDVWLEAARENGYPIPEQFQLQRAS
ncbi:MAG TPA: type II toxin-antitoxin system HicB family antitoxin [Dehalococcoidia bacterium]|nr:type II toxin-antitoxin system HicB family antitoxin [Dehalococcoidia bacterium]